MRFMFLFALAVFGSSWSTRDAHAWPRTRANTAYTSNYLAPYYPPGPIYSSNYTPYPAGVYAPTYYYPPVFYPGNYPSFYSRYDVPLTTTNIPRYFNGLPPPVSDEYSSDKWRR